MKRQISGKKLNNKVTCQICFYICKNYISLAKHLQHQHQIKSQEYYDKYLLKENENICTNSECKNITRFINLGNGYVKTCSRKCYGIMHTGKNNTFYGKKHKKEDLEKAVSTRMNNDSYNHTQETKDKIRKKLEGIPHDWGISGMTDKKHTEETKKILSLLAGGTGIPYENSEYPAEFNSILKDKIRERDNHTCQMCQITEEEHICITSRRLSVHHINYDKDNCKEENLISLCQQCHLRTNYNREYWENYFTFVIAKYNTFNI